MPATFSRPDKLSDAQTVLYEIDMLRFAANRLLRGKWESEKDRWAFLECYLIHYRNLIELLGKEQHLVRDTDLHVSNIWQRLHLPEPERLPYVNDQGSKLWAKYERVEDRISRYLQHCTTLRTETKSWVIGTMNEELESVLAHVEEPLRDCCRAWEPERRVVFVNGASNSTASVSSCAAAVESFSFPAPVKPKCK